MPSKEELEKHQPYARYLHPHKYPFLHVDPTPWPLFNAFHMSGLFWGLVLYTHFAQPDLFIMAFIGKCSTPLGPGPVAGAGGLCYCPSDGGAYLP